jgi:hypothetical protein
VLLSIGAAVLWARSYSGTDYLARRRVTSQAHAIETHGRRIAWTRGDIRLSVTVDAYYPSPSSVLVPFEDEPAQWDWGRLGAGHLGWDKFDGLTFWNRLGFHGYRGSTTSSFADWSEDGIAFPAWLPVAAFALPTVISLRRAARAGRRRAAGLCRRCGYDLRATLERCPECGADAPPIGATS